MDLYATCYNFKRFINLEPMDLLLLLKYNYHIKTLINACL